MTEHEPATQARTIRLDRNLTTRLHLASLVTETAGSDIIRTALRRHLREIEKDPANTARYAEVRAALPATDPKESS